jgi:hypothetical protein
MECRECQVCWAKWINNQLYWATGKPGENSDLNALVCRQLPTEKFEKCINPSKGEEGGIGWAERSQILEQGLDGL